VQSETVASITGRTRRLISAPAKLEALAAKLGRSSYGEYLRRVLSERLF